MNITDSMFTNFLNFIKKDFTQNFPAMDYILIGSQEDIEDFITIFIINDYFNFKNSIKLQKFYRIALLPSVSIETDLDALMEVNGHKFYANNLFDHSGIKVFINQQELSIEDTKIMYPSSKPFILFLFRLCASPELFLSHYKHLFFENSKAKFRGARATLIRMLFGNDAKDAGHINKKLNELINAV